MFVRSRWLDISLVFIFRFLFLFFDVFFVSVHKNAKKKKEEELGQYPAILTSRLVNSTDEHISCRPIQIWQGKTVQKMHFRARNLSNVKVSGLPFPCNSVHEVLTSALIKQEYRQNLLH